MRSAAISLIQAAEVEVRVYSKKPVYINKIVLNRTWPRVRVLSMNILHPMSQGTNVPRYIYASRANFPSDAD